MTVRFIREVCADDEAFGQFLNNVFKKVMHHLNLVNMSRKGNAEYCDPEVFNLTKIKSIFLCLCNSVTRLCDLLGFGQLDILEILDMKIGVKTVFSPT